MRPPTIMILCYLSLAGCGAEADETLRLHIQSEASAEFLATCISQNIEGAFPRFFPTEKADAARAFETYNGIRATVVDEGAARMILVQSTRPLTESMNSYVHFCVRTAEAG